MFGHDRTWTCTQRDGTRTRNVQIEGLMHFPIMRRVALPNWATWPVGFYRWKSRLGLEGFNRCGNKELRNDALSVAMFCWTEIYDLWDVLDDILCVWHILSLWCEFLQLSKGMSLAGLLLEFPWWVPGCKPCALIAAAPEYHNHDDHHHHKKTPNMNNNYLH